MESEANAIISKADGSNVSGLYELTVEYLRPLHGLLGFERLGFEGKENTAKTTAQIHALAKRFVTFLGHLLKASCNNLTKEISENNMKRADELFKTLKLALDCFDALRPCLVGPPHEIEVQRYWMVRRLMAWKRFREAREECWVTLRSLQVNVFRKELAMPPSSVKKKDVAASARRRKGRDKKEKDKDEQLDISLHGEFAEGADAGLVVLVLGLITDLVICTGDSKLKEAGEYRKVLMLIDQLMPWQRVSDKNTIEKHRSMLFKGLHKCALFMVTEPSHFDTKLTSTFCLLALGNCACSSVKDQLLKVTRAICNQLVSGGSELSSIVGDICKVALSTIFKDTLWQLYSEHEILDVVEFYCGQCEKNSKLNKDAKQFLDGIANMIGKGSSFSLPSVIHIYGIGLGFKDIEASSCDGITYADCEELKMPEAISCSEKFNGILLSKLVKTIQNMLAEIQTSREGAGAKCGYSAKVCSTKYDVSEVSINDFIQTGGTFINIFRALDFLLKMSSGYVQKEWEFFVANSTTAGPSACRSYLEQAFLVFARLFVAIEGCNCVPLDVKKELRRRCQIVLLSATAALKLSLMRLECSQDIFQIIETIISGGWVEVQELKWLMTCTYNIGVKMFNNKQFDFACNPLKLAYTAAWRRVSSTLNASSEEIVESECLTSGSENLPELISDACARSVVLVDVLHRSGSPKAREIIRDFLIQWSSADSKLSSLNNLRGILKLWVKMVFADYKEMETDESSMECLTLYKFLSDSGCILPRETLGILLEEELLAYTKFETDTSRLIQKRIRKELLENVYATKNFSFEQSRVLLEESKAARMFGSEGLDRCLDCLSDAILCLGDILNDNCSLHGKNYHLNCVRHQLAITYCLHAFCTQELNGNSEVIHDDISSALKLWVCIYKSDRLELNDEQQDWLFDTSITLLVNMSQMLALKGFTCLQSEVQEMILDILSVSKKLGPEESCALLWRESIISHPLCCIPFSANILSILTEKFGICVNSLKFWEKCTSDHGGSLLMFQQKLMYDKFIEAQADRTSARNSSFTSVLSIEHLKEKALNLAENGHKTTQSAYLASNLFYLLSEKYRQNGHLAEALKYSKESLLIRRKNFQRSFKILDKKATHFEHNDNKGRKGDLTEIEGISVEALGSVATNFWPNFTDSKNQLEHGPSQWIILGDYLESLMQMGVVYEMAGAANEAEYMLLEGLKISNAQDLPLSQASFGSSLGEIYRKCHKWNIAEEKLANAMQVFCRPDMKLGCKHCKVTVEAKLEMRIGDLLRRRPKEKRNVYLPNHLASAVDVYMSAKGKLDAIARIYTYDMVANKKMDNTMVEEKVESGFKQGSRSRLRRKEKLSGYILLDDEISEDVNELCNEMSKSHLSASLSYTGTETTQNRGAGQKGRSRKVVFEDSCIGGRDHVKVSESAYRKSFSCSKSASSNEMHKWQASTDVSRNGSGEASQQEQWQNHSVIENNNTCSMQELIDFNLECNIRSLMSRLLIQIGKCYEECEEFFKAHEIISQNISLLFFCGDRLPCLCSFVNRNHQQLKCPGRRHPVDILLIERAALLYHISWVCLKKNPPALSWIQCCDFAENRISVVTGWLHHSFIICSEMPTLLQKVSILLAIVHMPLTSGGQFSLPEDYYNNLSSSHWSAFFHQASLGTRLRQEHLTVLDEKLASCDSESNKVSLLNSRDMIKRVQQVLRLTPDKLDEQRQFIEDFYKCLPPLTIVCLSLLDSKYGSILEEQSYIDSSSAWILLSRFDSNGLPIVVLLPIHTTFDGVRKDDNAGDNLCSPYSLMNLEVDDLEGNDLGGSSEIMKWTSSSQTVLDVVAEEFGLVLEESRLSTSNTFPVASTEDKNKWWQWRMQLDNRLGNLLRGIENSWLGPWKCLLLGEPTEHAFCDALHEHLQDIKSVLDSAALNIGNVDNFLVDVSLLRILLSGISSLTDNEIMKGVSCLLWWKCLKHVQSPSSTPITSFGCSRNQNGNISTHTSFLSHCFDEESEFHEIIAKVTKEFDFFLQSAAARKNRTCNMHDQGPIKSSKKNKKQLKEENCKECRSHHSSLPCNMSNGLEDSNIGFIPREPVVLVLDANSQVLPWESLPILRQHEVYRMPSVGSISALMIYRGHQDSEDMLSGKEKKLLKRKNTKQEMSSRKNVSIVLKQPAALPVVDPYNAFYLLNPSGDLCKTQATFEDWFKNQQGWEGKTGVIPTREECILALQKHALFIYFGHGSGEQYMPARYIKRLDNCAAAVLMGCSSGRLSCRGDYEPLGVPLSYLMAGCPSIIANLWDVTDGDIDRFSKVLLNSWLEEQSSHCSEKEVLEELERLTISGHKSNRKVTRTRQKGRDNKDESLEYQQSLTDTSISVKTSALRTGSCIGEGRSKCKLPYLIGASPVCYGVPTTIKHK